MLSKEVETANKFSQSTKQIIDNRSHLHSKEYGYYKVILNKETETSLPREKYADIFINTVEIGL